MLIVIITISPIYAVSGDFIRGVAKDKSSVEEKYVYTRVEEDSNKYSVEVAYTYSGEKPKSILFTVPERGLGDSASGQVVPYDIYRDGKIISFPLILGMHVAARHVRGDDNNFMWLAIEFNRLLGNVNSELKFVKAPIKELSKITSTRDRMKKIGRLPRVSIAVPILSEESGLFYLPVQIDKDIISYTKGKLRVKVRVRSKKI